MNIWIVLDEKGVFKIRGYNFFSSRIKSTIAMILLGVMICQMTLFYDFKSFEKLAEGCIVKIENNYNRDTKLFYENFIFQSQSVDAIYGTYYSVEVLKCLLPETSSEYKSVFRNVRKWAKRYDITALLREDKLNVSDIYQYIEICKMCRLSLNDGLKKEILAYLELEESNNSNDSFFRYYSFLIYQSLNSLNSQILEETRKFVAEKWNDYIESYESNEDSVDLIDNCVLLMLSEKCNYSLNTFETDLIYSTQRQLFEIIKNPYTFDLLTFYHFFVVSKILKNVDVVVLEKIAENIMNLKTSSGMYSMYTGGKEDLLATYFVVDIQEMLSLEIEQKDEITAFLLAQQQFCGAFNFVYDREKTFFSTYLSLVILDNLGIPTEKYYNEILQNKNIKDSFWKMAFRMRYSCTSVDIKDIRNMADGIFKESGKNVYNSLNVLRYALEKKVTEITMEEKKALQNALLPVLEEVECVLDNEDDMMLQMNALLFYQMLDLDIPYDRQLGIEEDILNYLLSNDNMDIRILALLCQIDSSNQEIKEKKDSLILDTLNSIECVEIDTLFSTQILAVSEIIEYILPLTMMP